MSQLNQPGDYLKNNRTGASPPRVHMLTAESNQKVKRKLFQKRHSCPRTMRERTVRDNNQESSDLDTENCTHSTSESRHKSTRLERDVNREQHRSPDKSYGTMGRQ